GTPSLALKIAPSSQPFTNQLTGLSSELICGDCHIPLITRVRPTLKSDTARVNFGSTQNKLAMELLNWSPFTVAELLSILLPQVKEVCSCNPWLILLRIPSSRASQKDFDIYNIPRTLH